MEQLEVWDRRGRQLVPLTTDRTTVGRGDGNDIALADDPTASRLHAVFERIGAGWCVRDMASANGTFVNGERLIGERPLRPDDEVRVGATRLLFRATSTGPSTRTTSALPDRGWSSCGTIRST